MIVIVDLQEQYRAEFNRQRKAFNRMLKQLNTRLNLASISNEPVINLQTVSDGNLISEMKTLLKVHKLEAIPCFKTVWDGSEELIYCIQKNCLENEEIEFTGAFVNVCIYLTWSGLKKKNFNVLPVYRDLVMWAPGGLTTKIPEQYLGDYFNEENFRRRRKIKNTLNSMGNLQEIARKESNNSMFWGNNSYR